MLSISNVSSGQATSYFTKDDYYSKEQGQWQGNGANYLRLEGGINKEDFKKILSGKNLNGEQLVPNNSKGEHRAGVDLTFSAPKSLSVVSEIGEDKRVLKAHDHAVSTALQYVEKNFSQSRLKMDGHLKKVDTGNLLIAKFNHNTSRETDPQIHTHAVVMNMTKRGNDWRAISNEQLYKNKIFVGQIYRNELANNLKKIGYDVDPKKNGLFEIKGVDQKLLDQFSTRRKQIETALDGRQSGGKLAEKIALASRKGKTYDLDRDDLKKSWKSRANEIGFNKNNILDNTKNINSKNQDMKSLDSTVKNIEKQSVVWTKKDMLQSHLKNNLENGLTIKTAEAEIQKSVKNGKLIKLGTDKFTSKNAIETEKNIIKNLEARKNSASIKGIDPQYVSKKLENSRLNEDQRKAVAMITTSKSGVVAVQGYAGTGKTTMLEEAKNIFDKKGFEVRGVSFTGKAAETLQSEANIKSQTLHSFLGEKENLQQNEEKKQQVWIADEASMIGNSQMLSFLKAAEKENAKVVLLGDKAQLQAIDAGKPFQVIQEKKIVETAELRTILRQKNDNLKEAVHLVAIEKNPEKSVQKLDEIGAVKELSSKEDRLKAIADDYLAKDKNTLIVTATNKDRHEINSHIRDGLKSDNKINSDLEKNYSVAVPKTINEQDKTNTTSYEKGDIVRASFNSKSLGVERGDRFTVEHAENGSLSLKSENSNRETNLDLNRFGNRLETFQKEKRDFAPGDQVVFTKNDRSLGVVNGSMGQVAETKDNSLIINTNSGAKEVNLKNYDYLDHSYGMTTHKSQGQTVDSVIINIDTNQAHMNTANNYYVGVSRAREEVTIYTDSKENLPDAVSNWQEKESALDVYLSMETPGEIDLDQDLTPELEVSEPQEVEIEM